MYVCKMVMAGRVCLVREEQGYVIKASTLHRQHRASRAAGDVSEGGGGKAEGGEMH